MMPRDPTAPDPSRDRVRHSIASPEDRGATIVEGAFSFDLREALPFAVSRAAVRVFGLGLFPQVVFHDRAQRSADMLFAVLAATGLLRGLDRAVKVLLG